MYILFEAVPVQNRELITCSRRCHHCMEAGALSMGANAKRLYSFRAVSIISNLPQPLDDPFHNIY
jgi:hypothetical protein